MNRLGIWFSNGHLNDMKFKADGNIIPHQVEKHIISRWGLQWPQCRLSSIYNREPYSEIISSAHMKNTALWGDTFNPDSINGDQADSHVLPEYVLPHSGREPCSNLRTAPHALCRLQRGNKTSKHTVTELRVSGCGQIWVMTSCVSKTDSVEDSVCRKWHEKRHKKQAFNSRNVGEYNLSTSWQYSIFLHLGELFCLSIPFNLWPFWSN